MESDTTDWIMRIRSLDQQSWSCRKDAISVPNYPRKDFVFALCWCHFSYTAPSDDPAFWTSVVTESQMRILCLYICYFGKNTLNLPVMDWVTLGKNLNFLGSYHSKYRLSLAGVWHWAPKSVTVTSWRSADPSCLPIHSPVVGNSCLSTLMTLTW